MRVCDVRWRGLVSLTIVASFQTSFECLKVVAIARATGIYERETSASRVVKVITANVVRLVIATTYFGRHEANFYTCESKKPLINATSNY